MTKAKIDRALKPLGLEIQHSRRDGYSYFTSAKTGHQIGDSVFVCYLKSIPLAGWVGEARAAIREHRARGFRLHRHSQKL